MSLPTHIGRGSRIVYILAGTVFALHALLLVAAGSAAFAPLISNLIQLASALLAATACLFAARHMERFGRHF
ncbi:MAG TPA: hypothetical protein VFP96_13280, partial [Candidatus Acidoferrum sp.]|nr:hypothetical protein [Candidatus Acidoferrum sp.]